MNYRRLTDIQKYFEEKNIVQAVSINESYRTYRKC